MVETAERAWACPKDGTAMEPLGRRRRGNGWRCPTCKGVFLDVEAMRAARGAKPPVWAPVVWSVALSAASTVVARRLLRRRTP